MLRITIAIFCGVLIAGCDAGNAPASSSTQSNELFTLRQELDALKTEVEALKGKQSQDDLDRIFKTFDRAAFLQPGDTGYATVRYDLGVLTIELADVRSYANGSKVSLRFGNPLASTVNGLKTKIEWGHMDENGYPDNASAKSKDFTFTESLGSGAWTTIPVVLEGVPPSELGFVRVKDVTHTGIRLAR